MKKIVNSLPAFTALVSTMLSDFKQYRYLRVSWTTREDRTLKQNALWAAMYLRISEMLGDGSALDIDYHRAYCKLILGVPILRRDSEQFAKGWDRYFSGRSFEEQIYLMSSNPLFGVDGFPVTRLFDTRQGAEFTEAMSRHFSPQNVYFGDLLDD